MQVKLALLLVLSIALSSAQAQTTRAASPADAVVLVIANAHSGKELGQAFFIGDGSLAVAPRHVLYMQTNEAPSESLGLLTLLSPYFGDCAEARLVAEDVDEDLAIIRCEWKQHPALALADGATIKAAEEFDLHSWFEMGMLMAGVEQRVEKFDASSIHARRDYVGIRGEEVRTLSLQTDQPILKKGWSGSPVTISGTNQVAGMLTGMSAKTQFRRGYAAAAPLLQKLVASKGLDAALKPGPTAPRPADADKLLKLNIEARNADGLKQLDRSKEKYTALAEARPQNALYVVALGSIANDPAQSDKHFRRALELDPHSLTAMIFYSQFLKKNGRLEEARAILQQAREVEPASSDWAKGLLGLHEIEKRPPAENLPILEQALRTSPNDGWLWLYQGQTQLKLKDHAAAVKSLERANELLPNEVPAVAMLANALEAIGETGRAEPLFRKLIEMEPRRQMSHVMLAQFLFHQPGKQEEALKEMRIALALPDQNEVKRPEMEKMEAAFRAKVANTTRPASKPSESFKL